MNANSSSIQVPQSAIPVLTTRVPAADIPADVLAELERQQTEKDAFFALADALQHSLRPELDRLVSDAVQRSLQASWAQRHGAGAAQAAGNPPGPVDFG
jgi:hypothetical protein